ncbi:MAG: cation:proton antiporter [Verrucomicrobiales bacterium]
MTGLGLLLLSSATAFALAQRFRLPAIPLLIVLGFVITRLGVGMDRSALNQVLDVGLAFLVFAAGIELNPSRFTGQSRAILWIGVVQFLTAGTLGFLLARLIGFEFAASLYIGAGLSTSSTLVAVRQIYRSPGSLRTYGRHPRPHGHGRNRDHLSAPPPPDHSKRSATG